MLQKLIDFLLCRCHCCCCCFVLCTLLLLLSGTQDSLSLTLDEAQETLVGVLESRAKGIMQNIKADAMGGRDERVLEMAERLLK